MISSTAKTLLKNHIRHADAHNKVVEEAEMWRLYLQQKEEVQSESSRRKHSARQTDDKAMHTSKSFLEDDSRQSMALLRMAERRAHMDDETEQKESTYWTRQLQKFEENDPDRWGHNGYKELYPHDFDSDRENGRQDARGNSRDSRKKKKRKRYRSVSSVETSENLNFKKKHKKNKTSDKDRKHSQHKKPKKMKKRGKEHCSDNDSDIDDYEYTRKQEKKKKFVKNKSRNKHHIDSESDDFGSDCHISSLSSDRKFPSHGKHCRRSQSQSSLSTSSLSTDQIASTHSSSASKKKRKSKQRRKGKHNYSSDESSEKRYKKHRKKRKY